ncbi:MAG: hypothetical protein IKF71_01340 [Bacilli bacterium]|nr:hypothetical protein [Bacilli bacterium]
MSTFILDTESVSATKSTLDNLASRVDNIASEVNGYDTSCSEFDFSTPKRVIANNIEACGTKIKNTSSYINTVVSSHTTLQNNMKFESSAEQASKELQDQILEAAMGAVSYAGGGSYGGGSYYGGGYASSGYNASTVRVVNANISDVKYDKIETNALTATGTKLAEKSVYNDLGYATYGGMLLIGCSTAIGTVGDIIEFTMKDGTKKRCLIAQNTEGDNISFFVNDSWQEDNEKNPTQNFKENVTKIENYGNYQESTGIVDLTNLPAIGEYTSKWTALGEDWTVVTTKLSVPDYANVVASKRLSQTNNTRIYSDYCLAFAHVHASNMYNGYTGDTASDAGRYKHAGEFNNWYSNNKSDTLKKIYSEIVQGKPVILQVNGNSSGTHRHFVTVVGFRNSVTDPEQLTEDDLLILDSYDGKIERMDQSNSRFMTTGAQTGKNYSGYYLRTLK